MIDLNADGYPSDRGWGGPGRSEDDLTTIVLAGSAKLPLHVDSRVAPLVQALVNGLIKIREDANKPFLTSSGGYNKRKIEGTDRWSNHSWGLAVDLCAGANPYSHRRTTDFPVAATRALANSLGFRWGYDYSTKYDPMHFEFMGTPKDAVQLIATLHNSEDDVLKDQSVTNPISGKSESLDVTIAYMEQRIVNSLKASLPGLVRDAVLDGQITSQIDKKQYKLRDILSFIDGVTNRLGKKAGV